MRITSDEISSLIQAINHHVALSKAELRLYGSRLRNDSRGGDVDLLLVVPNDSQYDEMIQKKARILVEMKDKIGDQKIDLLITKKEDISQDPFVDLVFSGSQVLHQWS